MKKILIISYFFPPLTGVGTKRVSHFVNNLPDFGFEPIVLTIDPESLNNTHRSYGIVNKEKSLKINCKTYLSKMSFINSNAFNFLKKNFFFRAFIVFISIPDHFFFWIPNTYKIAKKIIIDEKIDIVLSTCPPYSSHIINLLLKRKFRDKIVCISDFRDEWSTNRNIKYVTKLHSKINKKLEKIVLNNSDYITTVTNPILDILKKGIKNKNKFYLIENCFSNDFYKIKKTNYNTNKLTITYTGSFYGKMIPDNLIKAIENLIIENEISKNDILLRFIGSSIKYKSNMFEIDNIDFLSHKDLIKYKQESDLLLLILEKDALNVYSGKIFDYISTGIPILGLIPKQGVADILIKETQTGFTTPLEDIESIKTLILDLIIKWKNKSIVINPKWDLIDQFSSKNITKKLVKILNNKSSC